jgi:hypothetical protein
MILGSGSKEQIGLKKELTSSVKTPAVRLDTLNIHRDEIGRLFVDMVSIHLPLGLSNDAANTLGFEGAYTERAVAANA